MGDPLSHVVRNGWCGHPVCRFMLSSVAIAVEVAFVPCRVEVGVRRCCVVTHVCRFMLSSVAAYG